MWPQQGQGVYYQGWTGQPQATAAASNPVPQSTDPTEWAQKAAQWAQQKQIQEQQQYQQQYQQYQYQQQLYQQQQQQQQQQLYQQPAAQYQYASQVPQAAMGTASYAPSYATYPTASGMTASVSQGAVAAQSSLLPAPTPSSLLQTPTPTPSSSLLPTPQASAVSSSPQPTPLFTSGSVASSQSPEKKPPEPPFPPPETQAESSVVAEPEASTVVDTTGSAVGVAGASTAGAGSSSLAGGGMSAGISVDQELTQRMRLFKEQLSLISSPGAPVGEEGEAPMQPGAGEYRGGRGGGRGGRGGPGAGEYHSRGRGGGSSFTPRGSTPRGGGRGAGRFGVDRVNPEFDSGRGGGVALKRSNLVNPDYLEDWTLRGGHPGQEAGTRGKGRGTYDRGRGGRGGAFDRGGRGRGGYDRGGGGGRGRAGPRGGGGGSWGARGGYQSNNDSYHSGVDQQYSGEYNQQQGGFNDGYSQRGFRGGRGRGRGGPGYAGYNEHSEQSQGTSGERWNNGGQRQESSASWEGQQQQLETQGNDQYSGEGVQQQSGEYGAGYDSTGKQQSGEYGAGYDSTGKQQSGEYGAGYDSTGKQASQGQDYQYRQSDYNQQSTKYAAGYAGTTQGTDAYNSTGQSGSTNTYHEGYDQHSAESAAVPVGKAEEQHGSETAIPVTNTSSGGETEHVQIEQQPAQVSDQLEGAQKDSIPEDTTDTSLYSEQHISPAKPTISSLQKDSTKTVIPGLGSSDEPEPSSEQQDSSTASGDTAQETKQEESELKSSLKTQLVDVFGGSRAQKMVQSMERIVNQLQTLRGLESSLKVLQYMGEQGKGEGGGGGESKPASSSSTTDTTMDPEMREMEEARKQVAALLATESDSDGESESVPRAPQPSSHGYGASSEQSQYDAGSETAREFDGTYNVTPKVFGTYSSGDSQDQSGAYHQEGDFGREGAPHELEGGYDQREGAYNRGRGRPYHHRGEGGREGDFRRGEGSYDRDYDRRDGEHGQRDPAYDQGQGGGYERDQGYNRREGGYDRDEGPYFRGRGQRGNFRGRGARYRGYDDRGGERGVAGDYPDARNEDESYRGDFSTDKPLYREGYRDDYAEYYANERRYGDDRPPGRYGDRYDNYDQGGGFPEGGVPPRREMDDYPRRDMGRPRDYPGGEREYPRRGDYDYSMERGRGGPMPPYQRGAGGGGREEGGYPGDRGDYRREESAGGRMREEGPWNNRQDYEARAPPPREPGYDQGPAPMDLDAGDDRTNIREKLETIDYSHGVQVAISRGWAGADGEEPAVQTVDYNHGQAGEYGGGFQAAQYQSYEGVFPGGVDAATLFAAYNEQAGDTKRKALPKWLSEELEKIEKKRQKTLEKEAEQLARQAEVKERPAWRDDEDEEPEPEEELLQQREMVPSPVPSPEPESEPQSIPPPVPPRTRPRVSRFRSMSPRSQELEEEQEPAMKRFKRPEPPAPVVAEEDEEHKAAMMLKLRKWMTEILLDVTSEEVDSVAREAYEEEQNKIRFIFKEPKFKPKRPKPNNILASLTMYESSSDDEEEDIDGTPVTTELLHTGPKDTFTDAIAKAFEDTIPSSGKGSEEKQRKRKSKWDVTASDKSSSSGSSSKSKSSSSSRHHSSSSSRRSSSRSSSSRSSSSHHHRSSSSSSSSRSSHHRSKSPSRSSRSSSSSSSSSSNKSSSSAKTAPVTIGVGTVPTTTLSSRWSTATAAELGAAVANVQAEQKGGQQSTSEEGQARAVSPSHSMFRYQ